MFPLYNTLLTESKSDELSDVHKKSLLKQIKKMDDDSHSILYIIIKKYYIDHDISNDNVFPYNCEFVEKNVKFDLNVLPNKLQQMLFEFVKKHTKKIKDDKQLETERSSYTED